MVNRLHTKTIDGSQNIVQRSTLEECSLQDSVQSFATGGINSLYNVPRPAVYHRGTKNLYNGHRSVDVHRCTLFTQRGWKFLREYFINSQFRKFRKHILYSRPWRKDLIIAINPSTIQQQL